MDTSQLADDTNDSWWGTVAGLIRTGAETYQSVLNRQGGQAANQATAAQAEKFSKWIIVGGVAVLGLVLFLVLKKR